MRVQSLRPHWITLTAPRAIGETMERLDVLIALRKASESHTTGKEETNKEDAS